MHYVGGKSGCLDEAPFVCHDVQFMALNANIVNFGAFSWTMLHFCNVCNSATDFFNISRALCRRSAQKCCSISVRGTFFTEQSRCTFVLSFVSFNVASEVTEIDRISVVMHVSD